MPDSKALDLTWDKEDDIFRVHCFEFVEAFTKDEISSPLASQFDPLGMASRLLLVN